MLENRPQDYINYAKFFLYGESQIDYETIVVADIKQLIRKSPISSNVIPNPLREIMFKTIVNRIYYGVFHYALNKTSIKVAIKDKDHIHKEVLDKLRTLDLYEEMDSLRVRRVFADYGKKSNKIKDSRINWYFCHLMMIDGIELIKQLGYDILFTSLSVVDIFNPKQIKILDRCNSRNSLFCKDNF